MRAFCAWGTAALALLLGDQARDPASTVTPLSAVAGQIIDTASTPLPRAVVTLRSESSREERSVVADNDGRFAFREVADGLIALRASKPGFISAPYGSLWTGDDGVTLRVKGGAPIDIMLRLKKGAALSGIVRTGAGEPVPDTTVIVTRVGADGRRLAGTALTVVSTDDRGAYRAFGLTDGTYVVSASPSAAGLGMMVELNGDIIDQTFAAHTSGQRAGSSPIESRLQAGPGVAFAPTFYPGTPVAAEATPVALAAGEDRADLDFELRLVRTATIEGTMSVPNGTGPTGISLALLAPGPVVAAHMSLAPMKDSAVAPPTFRFSALPPGKYTIVARTPTSPRTAPTAQLWASSEVEVNGSDVKGVHLAMRPAGVIRGRLAFQSRILKDPDLAQVRVVLDEVQSLGTSVLLGDVTIFTRSVWATPDADGGFRIAGVLPGRYHVRVEGVRMPWFVMSAVSRGQESLDSALEYKDESIDDLSITLSDESATLVGQIRAPSDEWPVRLAIVLVPVQRDLWAAERRIRIVRPSSDGSFEIRHLPAGDYVLAASTDVSPAALDKPEVLEGVIANGIKLTLKEAEFKRQDIALAPPR